MRLIRLHLRTKKITPVQLLDRLDTIKQPYELYDSGLKRIFAPYVQYCVYHIIITYSIENTSWQEELSAAKHKYNTNFECMSMYDENGGFIQSHT